MPRDGPKNPSLRKSGDAVDELVDGLVCVTQAGELGSPFGNRLRLEAKALLLVPEAPRKPHARPSGWGACQSPPR